MDRVMQSVRVRVGFPSTLVRQSFGSMGVSLLVGDKRLEPKVIQDAADPDFAREESATVMLDKTIVAVYEFVSKTLTVPVTDARGKVFVDGFMRGLSKSAGMNLIATQKDSFPINIDGVQGRHIIYDISADNRADSVVVQLDYIMLAQDKKFWTLTVVTNYDGGLPRDITGDDTQFAAGGIDRNIGKNNMRPIRTRLSNISGRRRPRDFRFYRRDRAPGQTTPQTHDEYIARA